MSEPSKEEKDQILAIVDRAVEMARKEGIPYQKIDAHMDIFYCHTEACPLLLGDLLAAPDSDFGHDVFGIRRYLDRVGFVLMECFLPRCAAPEEVAS